MKLRREASRRNTDAMCRDETQTRCVETKHRREESRRNTDARNRVETQTRGIASKHRREESRRNRDAKHRVSTGNKVIAPTLIQTQGCCSFFAFCWPVFCHQLLLNIGGNWFVMAQCHGKKTMSTGR